MLGTNTIDHGSSTGGPWRNCKGPANYCLLTSNFLLKCKALEEKYYKQCSLLAAHMRNRADSLKLSGIVTCVRTKTSIQAAEAIEEMLNLHHKKNGR